MNKSTFTATFSSVLSICAAAALQLVFVAGAVRAEEKKLTEPVYRVASETPAAQPTTTAQNVATTAAPASKTPLDFTKKGDEHPLAPVLRNLKVSQDELGRAARLYQGDSTWEVANPYSSLFQHVHPLVIGAVDRASALSTRLCIEILGYHMSDLSKAETISNTLNAGYPSHSYPITLREAGRIGLKVEPLPDAVNRALLELNAVYSEMGQRAMTDFDDRNAHDNSILTIIDGAGRQVFYQQEKDWHYRTEERRWITLNDRSSWRRAERAGDAVSVSDYPIR